MKLRIALIGITILLLQGCSIHQNVISVQGETIDEICVIDNPTVKESFRKALTEKVQDNNIKARVISEDSKEEVSCQYTMEYTANWAWDLALYLVYTKIELFKEGDLIGEAIYDARRGGGRMDKFINAENKIEELIKEMLKG